MATCKPCKAMRDDGLIIAGVEMHQETETQLVRYVILSQVNSFAV